MFHVSSGIGIMVQGEPERVLNHAAPERYIYFELGFHLQGRLEKHHILCEISCHVTILFSIRESVAHMFV